MTRTIEEINEKIRSGKAVVVNAEEVIDIVREKGVKQAYEQIDVVTTGTFGPMCSSSAYFNTGHSSPRIKFGGGRLFLNDVPAYPGIAAVDFMLGCNALPDDDPRNRNHPGDFNYGGGHVIHELVAGNDVRLSATAYGTDCYPRKKLDTWISLKDFNEAVLFNPRNCYQNYNIACNLTDKTIYTYMGILKPNLGNITYCSAGQLSPLLNDPLYQTVGIGTRIFLGGGTGYVAWQGTQHDPTAPRSENGVPRCGAGTLAVIGDLKTMNPRWLVGVSMQGYGCSMAVGIGIPIPILSEEILQHTAVSDDELYGAIVDYGGAYPVRNPDIVGEISYGDLKKGRVTVRGKDVPVGSLSSYPRALEIAETLKGWIQNGKFLLTKAVSPLPGADSDYVFKPMNERPITE